MVYRILSLDGGGIRGVLAAQILASLETLIDQPLHEYFDMIAGTSTGSIVAANLILEKSAKQIVELYRKNGSTIFPYWGKTSYLSPKRLKLLFNYGLSAPKFSNQGLCDVLKQEFGETRTVTDITLSSGRKARLLIFSYDTVSRSPIVFKSWRTSNWYADVPLWVACTCSASAPTFFPAYQVSGGGKSCAAIDGGVAANNPVTGAIAEAINLGQKIEDIRVLSIGTGEYASGFPYKDVRQWGVLQWAGHIIDVLMDAPVDINDYVARQLVNTQENERDRYVRLQPLLSNACLSELFDVEIERQLPIGISRRNLKLTTAMDNASRENIEALIALGKGYVKNGKFSERLTVREKIQDFIDEASTGD